ncbi:hypothetical protein B484DRAFT_409075 [Ochromonadaceae sp. CCMP2298]|nr:hypothetical protein B484DRAFT_409075 [Ochromonadaceae sp. CCMP2298]
MNTLLPLLALLVLAVALADPPFVSTGESNTPVALGRAAPYALLAGAAITNTGNSQVTGNIGVYPGVALTFGTGTHTGDAIKNIGTAECKLAQDDLTVAYNDAATRQANADYSNVDLGGLTLAPGVYKFGAAAALNGKLTLQGTGSADDAWTFQIGSALYFAALSEVSSVV